jgi:hypothetical protein
MRASIGRANPDCPNMYLEIDSNKEIKVVIPCPM